MEPVSNSTPVEQVTLQGQTDVAKEVEKTEDAIVSPSPQVENRIAQKAADILEARQTASSKKAPALHLKKISKKDVDKMDHALAKKHISENAKNIQWDAARKIVVLEKSGKTRAYKIGNGAGPALAESSSRSAVLNHIKNIKA